MKADFARYVAEAGHSDGDVNWKQICMDEYEAAFECVKDLSVLNDVRLGIILNHSVTLHEIKGDTESACVLAKEAIEAVKAHEKYLDNSSANARSIAALLQENISMWDNANEDEASGGAEEEPRNKPDA